MLGHLYPSVLILSTTISRTGSGPLAYGILTETDF